MEIEVERIVGGPQKWQLFYWGLTKSYILWHESCSIEFQTPNKFCISETGDSACQACRFKAPDHLIIQRDLLNGV